MSGGRKQSALLKRLYSLDDSDIDKCNDPDLSKPNFDDIAGNVASDVDTSQSQNDENGSVIQAVSYINSVGGQDDVITSAD